MTNDEALNEYIVRHIDEEDTYLYNLYRATNVRLVRSHMASGHLQGQLLRLLVKMMKPHRILEIGTYSGYSGLCMASALEKGGRLVTYEINDELEDFTREMIEHSPWAERVDFRIGDVLHDLPEDEANFDLIFLDGNKREYVKYYELCLKILNPQGVILADNTLWDGHVIDAAYDNDAQTLGIREFNDYVAQDKRVEKVILPLRDGLTLIRLRE